MEEGEGKKRGIAIINLFDSELVTPSLEGKIEGIQSVLVSRCHSVPSLFCAILDLDLFFISQGGWLFRLTTSSTPKKTPPAAFFF